MKQYINDLTNPTFDIAETMAFIHYLMDRTVKNINTSEKLKNLYNTIDDRFKRVNIKIINDNNPPKNNTPKNNTPKNKGGKNKKHTRKH